MDADALNAFMAEAFPQSEPGSRGHVVSAVPGHIQARLDPTDKALRPGGLISGPTQMGFADMVAYALVLAHIGPVAMAVTSALNYQFLRPCRPERSEEHTSELQSLMRISYAVFCLKKTIKTHTNCSQQLTI